ncbi:DUF262 domain-containing protein [Nitratiruptor tergarcus]|uniref:Uncharacterized protein n=1 Tax=Nitratiruptor tergarcus DSM 16512 TaxID=1069081 RepID=A0A1W1WRQ9_9BACT|nr:DUF262 domain-containing protein [Nitratiruptor tergarcus]SMC08403.1 Protein of unknown function DUF262 [Nitratiruptor tergarcus DSM 16512]
MSQNEQLCAYHYRIKNLEDKSLVIPEFQRPYEWDKNQVEQFLKDLDEVFNKQKDSSFEYLIGNMVIYKNENEWQIVDGQQRIITLGIVLQVLGYEEFCKKIEVKTSTMKTNKNIFNNKKVIENFFSNYSQKNEFKQFLLSNIVANFLITKDLDFAFFLFDSHNTRGKALDRKDLLKVHHIRLIKKEDEKSFLAKKWESYERVKDIDKEKDKLKYLLQLLAVCRKAVRGELRGHDLIESDVYKEFLSEANEYSLNNYNQPPIFETFEYFPKEDELRLLLKRIDSELCFGEIRKEAYRYLPFEIPQSIEGGEKFFYFLIKYFNLLSELEKTHGEIFNLFDKVSGSGNQYINLIYKSLLFFYYDKFGEENLKEFAWRLIIIFSYLRITQTQMRKETIVNSFAKPNAEKKELFKCVFLSYSTEVILNKLDDYIKFEVGDEKDKKKLSLYNNKKHYIGDKEITGTTKDFIDAWEEYHKEIFNLLDTLGRNWR